jgi:hypothetical protein
MTVSGPDTLTNLVRSIADQPAADVLFWSGAGISVPGPTSLPTGWELTERVFRSFFEPDALARILGHHANAGWLSSALCQKRTMPNARLPRLETVLGVAFRQFGELAHPVLADLRTARPNWHHRFLAAHLKAGGFQVTANFDTCIEDAHFSGYGSATKSVEHFHRSLDADTTPSELGATLEIIQGGFPEGYGDRIVEYVANAPVSVFIGYSGSDFFDIDVAFATRARNRLAGREVHWISHSEHCEFHTVTPDDTVAPQLGQLLTEAGATVRYHCGHTGTFLSRLAQAWEFELEPTSFGRRQLRDGTIQVDDQGRRAATLALYREFGIPAEIDRMLDYDDLNGVPEADLWQARSESLWEAGQWSTLRRMWAHGERPQGITDVMRQERIGACLWVQGRFLPAYLWLARHRRRAEQERRASDAWLLAETEARVIEHMARTPELRLLARVLARGAVRRLGEPDQREGVHRFRRHSDLDTSLKAAAEGRSREVGHAETSVRWFSEAGSMIGALGYAHRALRDSYHPAQPRDEVRRRYRSHFRWALGMGSRAGAWRMILLPDAHRVFSFAEAVAGVFALQYGNWQRIRILARFLAKRRSFKLSRVPSDTTVRRELRPPEA